MDRGFWFGVAANLMWGFFPLYWKQLQHVPALQLLGHRILWSFPLLLLMLFLRREGKTFRKEIASLRTVLIYAAAAVFLSANWLTYVWAVNAGYIVETSLGYFINPLFSMLLGVVILRERLRPFQWIPVCLAAAGVLYLTFVYGSFPWIGLTVAFSFGMYGFIKKTAPLDALHGLTLETAILFLPALAILFISEGAGQGAFGHAGAESDLLLVGAGAVTIVPLLLFAAATRRITLFMVGVLQYITPTLSFLTGVLVFGEPLSAERLTGFVIIWLALILLAVEGYIARRRSGIPAVTSRSP
ncbi:MAG: EamA family transporter RarD [Anaerolineales bacterium]